MRTSLLEYAGCRDGVDCRGGQRRFCSVESCPYDDVIRIFEWGLERDRGTENPAQMVECLSAMCSPTRASRTVFMS